MAPSSFFRTSLFIVFAALLASSGPAAYVQTTSQGAPAQTQSNTAAAPLPRVFLFATGGTISNKTGGRLTVEELIQSVPNLDRRVTAEGEQFANVASGAITMDQWLGLARQINDKFKKDAGLSRCSRHVGH